MQFHTRRTQVAVSPQCHRRRHIRPDPQVAVDLAGTLSKDDVIRCAALVGDRPVLADHLAGRSDRHGDTYGGAVLLVDPRMVGDSKDQAQPVLGVEMLRDDAAAEHLRDRIGGDKTESPCCAAANRRCSAVPPMHHEICALGHVGCGKQCFEIAIAQPLPHILATDEGRVADDEVRTRPDRRPDILVTMNRNPCGFVGHQPAGDGMSVHRLAIPAGDRVAVCINFLHPRIPGDQRVPLLDGADVAQDWLGRSAVRAAHAEMPLQIADPQHQLRNRSRAWIDFDAKEILGRDGVAGDLRDILVVAQFDQQVEHLALQFLHPRHGDIEEIARPAGRIEHLRLREARVKCLDISARLTNLAAFDEGRGCDAHPVPIGAQRFHDGRADKPLDISARCVMRAEP